MKKNSYLVLLDFDGVLYDIENKKLYSDAIKFTEWLLSKQETILFTEGDRETQKKKIKDTGVDKIFKNNIRIYEPYSKMKSIQKELDRRKVVLIEDNPENIEQAVQNGWKTVRIRRGRYSDVESIEKPDTSVNNLEQLMEKGLLYN